MQENDMLKLFPQPPRGFRGKLDPLVVIEHFEDTVGMVRRFGQRIPEFTEECLLGHLATYGVRLYGPVEDWDVLFGEIRDQIVSDGAERKPPVQVSWVVNKLGEKATYSMIETPTVEATEQSPPAEAAAVVAASTIRDVPTPERGGTPDRDRMLANGVRSILATAADGMMRRRALTATVAGSFDIATADARRFINGALSAGWLSKVGNQGVTFISVSTEEQMRAHQAPDGTQESDADDEDDRAEAELAELDAYMSVVSYVMRALVALRDISRGQTHERLRQRSGLGEDMDIDTFKRYVRHMQDDGLVVFLKDASQNSRTPKHKVIRPLRVYVASNQIRSNWKVNAEENLEKMYERALEKIFEEHE